jgi:hypothetical protein
MYQEELKISVTHIYITKLPGWYPILFWNMRRYTRFDKNVGCWLVIDPCVQNSYMYKTPRYSWNIVESGIKTPKINQLIKSLSSSDVWNILVIAGVMTLAKLFSNLGEMMSGPAALWTFKFCNSFKTPLLGTHITTIYMTLLVHIKQETPRDFGPS